MFDAVFLKKPTNEQAAAFYGLLAKEPGQTAQSDLEAAKTAMDQLNEQDADEGKKEYRDSCVALSLFLLYGGGTEQFDQEEYGRAFTTVFPEKATHVEAVVGCAQFIKGLRTVVYRTLPEKYEALKGMEETLDGWELLLLMAKRALLDVMLKVQDFQSVKDAVRELSGEIVAQDPATLENAVELRNEFGDL